MSLLTIFLLFYIIPTGISYHIIDKYLVDYIYYDDKLKLYSLIPIINIILLIIIIFSLLYSYISNYYYYFKYNNEINKLSNSFNEHLLNEFEEGDVIILYEKCKFKDILFYDLKNIYNNMSKNKHTIYTFTNKFFISVEDNRYYYWSNYYIINQRILNDYKKNN